jgi:hypothetical protein
MVGGLTKDCEGRPACDDAQSPCRTAGGERVRKTISRNVLIVRERLFLPLFGDSLPFSSLDTLRDTQYQMTYPLLGGVVFPNVSFETAPHCFNSDKVFSILYYRV